MARIVVNLTLAVYIMYSYTCRSPSKSGLLFLREKGKVYMGREYVVNYGIYLLAIVALLLLVSIVRHSAYMERKRNFQYDITALCVVVALAGVVGRDYAEVHHLYWLTVVSAILIDTASVVYFLFFIGSLRSWKSAVMRVFEVIGGIIVIMALASPKTGWIFTISSDGAFEKGPFQPIAALYLIAGFIALIVINFKKYKKCEAEDIVRMICLFSLEAIAILLQVLDSQMFQDGFIGSTLLIILYYDFVVEIESKYDNLSGVGSSTYFNSYVDRISKKGAFLLIMFDVNGLKHANDTMGHEVGDKLISAVGQGIREAVGVDGKVFRIGGDEFMAVLLTTDEERGREVVKKADVIFETKSKELNMTISAASGITVRKENEDIRDAKNRVDAAMYKCKQHYYQQTVNDRRS